MTVTVNYSLGFVIRNVTTRDAASRQSHDDHSPNVISHLCSCTLLCPCVTAACSRLTGRFIFSFVKYFWDGPYVLRSCRTSFLVSHCHLVDFGVFVLSLCRDIVGYIFTIQHQSVSTESGENKVFMTGAYYRINDITTQSAEMYIIFISLPGTEMTKPFIEL